MNDYRYTDSTVTLHLLSNTVTIGPCVLLWRVQEDGRPVSSVHPGSRSTLVFYHPLVLDLLPDR